MVQGEGPDRTKLQGLKKRNAKRKTRHKTYFHAGDVVAKQRGRRGQSRDLASAKEFESRITNQ